MKSLAPALLLFFLLLAGRPSAADAATEPRAIRPLDGYTCMVLNLSHEQIMNPAIHLFIRAEPSPHSHPIDDSETIVFAKWPLHIVHGYIEVLTWAGKRGWVSRRALVPYHQANPSETCTPYLMSDGLPGIGP